MPRIIRRRDVVCVGSVGWRAQPWTTEHHLAARLARDNRVLAVEPRRADAGRLAGPLGSALGRARDAAGVHVLTPPAVPGATGARLLGRATARAARRLRFGDVLLWAFSEDAAEVADALTPAHVVYHCLREPADAELELRLARQADVVLAGTPSLARRLADRGIRARPAPPVADTAAFSRALASGPVDPAIGALPRPRVVIVGSSPAPLDVGLLAAVAERRRDWSFAVVGPLAPADAVALAPLRAAPNVHLLGARPYAAMPEVLRGADAGLVPYRDGRRIASMCPMHVFEHLAAGLPVVATPLPALAGRTGVRLADGAAAIAATLGEALEQDDIEARRQRSAAVAGHSWDARLDEVGLALRGLAA